MPTYSKYTLQRFFCVGAAALNCRTSWPPWYCPKPPQKCFGRGRRIRRSNCSNYHFIYLFIYWAKFTSSPQKKWRWELLYKRPFFFFGKKWAQFATFMRNFFFLNSPYIDKRFQHIAKINIIGILEFFYFSLFFTFSQIWLNPFMDDGQPTYLTNLKKLKLKLKNKIRITL